MSLTAMDIEAKIPVYEIDGDDKSLKDLKITIKSHWNRNSLVVIVLGGKEYTVSADALDKAVARCSGY